MALLIVGAMVVLAPSCTDVTSASGGLEHPGSSTTIAETGSTTTTTTTTTTTPPIGPASLALEPLVLDDFGSPNPIRPTTSDEGAGPLSATDLATRPLLTAFDDPTVGLPPPDLGLEPALAADGFEGAYRVAFVGRSHPSVATITLVRFTTDEGAASAATRLRSSLLTLPNAIDGGAPDGVPDAMLASVPAPPLSGGPPTLAVLTLVLGRDLVIVASHEGGGPLRDTRVVERLATEQRARLVDANPATGP